MEIASQLIAKEFMSAGELMWNEAGRERFAAQTRYDSATIIGSMTTANVLGFGRQPTPFYISYEQ